VTLSEEDGVRYLHFGTEWIQGGMRIARPWQLELEYQRQMMALALFLPRPARILQLGLGAAALTKFCYRHLPDACITAVELSAEVIEVARRSFALPLDDDRLVVAEADARDYLSTLRRGEQADWLQVDLYDAAARGPVHDDARSTGFAGALRRPESPVSICSVVVSIRALCDRRGFDDRVLTGPTVDEGNRIVYAFSDRASTSRRYAGAACNSARKSLAYAGHTMVGRAETGQRIA
jgi:hypothetical protein